MSDMRRLISSKAFWDGFRDGLGGGPLWRFLADLPKQVQRRYWMDKAEIDQVLDDDEEHGPVFAAVAYVWGRRCPDFEPNCFTCRAWAEFDKIEALSRERQHLRVALTRSMTALDDWLNIFAEDMCDERRVEEAKRRVHEFGTIHYISWVQQMNRSALHPAPIQKEEK